ncbi:MAG: hypothetical protein HYY84_20200 [Deltaproteobacteria bacterium]|nr:hypothetical protein [Deltaproteobacteria bacterium]
MSAFSGAAHAPPPGAAEAPQPLMQGTVTGVPSAKVSLVDSTGASVADTTSTASETFSFTLRAQTAYRNLRTVVTKGQLVLIAFAPTVSATTPGQSTPPIASIGAIDDLSTMAAFVVSEKLRQSGLTLTAVQPSVVSQAVALVKSMATTESVLTFWRMIVDLKAAADTTKSDVPIFNVGAFSSTSTTSFLNRTFLTSRDLDYTRDDGGIDKSTDAFDLALANAARAFTLPAPTVCLDPNKARLVFTVNMNAGQKDGNCDTINRFLWAQDSAGSTMWFTGSVHEESHIQDPAVNELLGNFKPNIVPMYDDGTHGDAVPGDGVWTVSFDVPWTTACGLGTDGGVRFAGASDAGISTTGLDAGTLPCLRVGYKYTWGKAGAGWTGTEEFPGNRHILEVVDVNGDGIVHRADSFADETTNKDKANARRPAKGGTGTVTWTTDADGDGFFEARESPIDSDGDCQPNGWPTAPAVEPISLTCPT